MTVLATARSLLPGMLVVMACAAAGFALARLPGAHLLGPLLLALVLAALWRALVVRGRPLGRFEPGARFAAGPLLKLGIVALGVRLDLRAVVALGPWLLLGSAVGALAAFAVAEIVGRRLGVAPALRRATGVGTAICGASAIAAAAPVLGLRAGQASAAIGAISLLGTLGVLGFVAWDALADVAAASLGTLAGATLQEVGQVVAAGSIAGPAGADVALLVKLSRVVLLAPALVTLSWWARREEGRRAGGEDAQASQSPGWPQGRPRIRWPLPPFVLGFLASGAAVSAGWLSAGTVALVSDLGTLLTTAAMAGIGLGLDLRAVPGPGRQAIAVGAAAFAALLVAMTAYYALIG